MLPPFFPERIKNLKERLVLQRIKTFLALPEAIVLLGMRQTGKTSLLFLTAQLLQKQKIPTDNLFYFSLEDPTILSSFNKNIKELSLFLKNQKINEQFKTYILIDEIQYLKNPSNFLKYYLDNFPKLKFIVTGSSSFQLKRKFKDSLAGRKKTVLVKPLSFKEFLFFQEFDSEVEINFSNLKKTVKQQIDEITKEKIKTYFHEFLQFGGHPKICLLDNKELKIEELKDIYNDYIRKDIKDLAEIENLDAYNNLLQVLASQVAGLLNNQEISNTVGLNHLTLKKYIFLLENSFVIYLVKPYFKNKRKELTKMPKIYFEDLGIRNAVLANFQEIALRQDLGRLAENFVFNELDKRLKTLEKINFWRTLNKQEVDFVYQANGKNIPIEVKYQSFKTAKIPSSLKSFIKTYQPAEGVVITKDFLGQQKFEKTNIYFLPIYYF